MYYKAILKIGQVYEIYVTEGNSDCAAQQNMSWLGQVIATEQCNASEFESYRNSSRYIPGPSKYLGINFDNHA